MRTSILAGLVPLILSGAASAAADGATTVDLVRGHYLVSAGRDVATYELRAIDRPGRCRHRLALEPAGAGVLRLVRGDPACDGEPLGELRLNPDWHPALRIVLGAGQIDLAPSLVATMGSLDALVSVGDIVGSGQVRRRRLVGAALALDTRRDGVRLRVEIGAGQLSLDAPATRPAGAR